MTARTGQDAISRTVGVAVALVAILQLGIHGGTLVEALARDPFWGPADAAVAALLVVTVVGTFWFAVPTLRRLWVTLALLGLGLRWTWEFTGHGLDDQPWIYFMQPTFAVVAAAAWPLLPAVGYTLLSVGGPPLLAWTGLVSIAPDVAADATRQLLSVMFVVALHLVRHQQIVAERASLSVLEARTIAAGAEATLRVREREVGLIHDEVVASLLAVAHDPVGDQAGREAAAAIAVVTAELTQERPVDRIVDLAAVVPAVTTGFFPDASVATPRGKVLVPGEVGNAVVGALREALRNVDRHAGPAGISTVRVVVSRGAGRGIHVRISDDGAGFRPGDVDGRRLGLRHGVHGRMAALAAGRATVSSSPDQGTVVTLQWRP